MYHRKLGKFDHEPKLSEILDSSFESGRSGADLTKQKILSPALSPSPIHQQQAGVGADNVSKRSGHYEIGARLNQGATADVFAGIRVRRDGSYRQVVLKRVKTQGPRFLRVGNV